MCLKTKPSSDKFFEFNKNYFKVIYLLEDWVREEKVTQQSRLAQIIFFAARQLLQLMFYSIAELNDWQDKETKNVV